MKNWKPKLLNSLSFVYRAIVIYYSSRYKSQTCLVEESLFSLYSIDRRSDYLYVPAFIISKESFTLKQYKLDRKFCKSKVFRFFFLLLKDYNAFGIFFNYFHIF